MQSIQQLDTLVKQGSISHTEADAVLEAVVGRLVKIGEFIDDNMSVNMQHFDKTAEVVGSAVTQGITEGLEVAKSSPFKGILTAILSTVGLAGAGLAGAAVTDWMSERKEKKQHEEAYDSMMSYNPDLKNADKADVDKYFSIFSTSSPTMAKNPHLAANFVKRNLASYGGVGFEDVGQLARAEAALDRKGPSIGTQFSQGLIQQGLQGIGQHVMHASRIGIEDAMRPNANVTATRKAEEEQAYRGQMKARGMGMGLQPMNEDEGAAKLKMERGSYSKANLTHPDDRKDKRGRKDPMSDLEMQARENIR